MTKNSDYADRLLGSFLLSTLSAVVITVIVYYLISNLPLFDSIDFEFNFDLLMTVGLAVVLNFFISWIWRFRTFGDYFSEFDLEGPDLLRATRLGRVTGTLFGVGLAIGVLTTIG